MLSDFSGSKVYLACGYTDLRRGIDGLATIIEQQFKLDPCSDTLFLFCGRRTDRIKALYWERDCFQHHRNDLDPYEYLKYVFEKAPNLKENESIDILLPWNAPDDCRSKGSLN
jgi:hypothetical protein